MRALTRRSGVRDYQFDIDTGMGWFLPMKDQPVDFGGIQEAVAESGFELLWLEADVLGILGNAPDAQGDPHPALRVEATGQSFTLTEGTTEQEREGYGRLTEWLEGGNRTVLIRGRVHSHPQSSPGMTVREFRVVQ